MCCTCLDNSGLSGGVMNLHLAAEARICENSHCGGSEKREDLVVVIYERLEA